MKSFLDRVFLWLVGFVGYWSENLYNFRINEKSTLLSAAGPDHSSKRFMLIVARKHYFETVKEYPIGRLSDLRGILRNEIWRYPFEGKLFLRIDRVSDHSHRVTSWVIRQNVIDELTFSPYFLVPETACIQLSEPGEVTSLDRLDSTLFVSLTVNGLISIEGKEALFMRQVKPHSEIDGDKTVEMTRLSESDSVGRVLVGALSAIKKSPLSFYDGPKWSSFGAFDAGHWFKVLASASLFYLGAASIFIAQSGYYQERSLRALNTNTDSVLELRNEVLGKRRELSSINEALANRGQISVGWDLFLDLKAMGVDFLAVNTNASEIEFFCSYKNATAVLQYLKNDSRVASADLSSAILNERGNERFSVKVSLKADELSSSKDVVSMSVDISADLDGGVGHLPQHPATGDKL